MMWAYREFDVDCWEVYDRKTEKRTMYCGTEDMAQMVVTALNAGTPSDTCGCCYCRALKGER